MSFAATVAFPFALLACAALALALPPTTRSDNYATGIYDEAGYRADNREHTYCWHPSFDGETAKDSAHYAMKNLAEQTVMFRNKVPECTDNTDVKWLIRDLPGDGRYECLDFSSTSPLRCGRARVKIDRTAMSGLNDWKQTSCHETGHSVGLRHNDNDCLGQDPTLKTYSPHHVNHVNNNH